MVQQIKVLGIKPDDEYNTQELHNRKKELTPTGCPLVST